MATLHEIRRRIKSVRNIGQVTRAMQAVAASKMQRAQDQVKATRTYAEKAWEVLTHLAAQRQVGEELHPLLQVRPLHTVVLVVLTGDRGLCGAFNHNIIVKAVDFMEESEWPVKLITVGRKGRDFMHRHGEDIVAEFTGIPDQPRLVDVTPIARVAIDGFLEGRFDQVFLAYSDFINVLTQRPTVKRLLPIMPAEIETQAMAEYVESVRPLVATEYIYEPDPRSILDEVLPRFTELQIYQAILESIASEHSARMVAMRNASDNAEELVGGLTLDFNKARQRAITLEIMDIAGGAEALAQARGN
ncbi:MAG: ATP synthase F1 subunit gamma [Anaerolineae bacterium]